MGLTREEKRIVAGRARTLQERLENPPPADSGPPVEDPDAVIDAWKRRVADGDPGRFRRRLEREGALSLEACRRRLRTHGWPEGEPLPEWIERVSELVEFVERRDPDEIDVPDDWEARVPFAPLFATIVEYATARTDRLAASPLVTEAGLESVQSLLVTRLQMHAAHPLFLEFKTYVAHHDRELALGERSEPLDDPRRYYDQFVELLFDDGFRSFVLEYSFLARLLGTILAQWVATFDEFCTRLAADVDAIGETFTGAGDERLGAVTDVDDLGDRHHDGRMTLGVTFSSGTTVAYKPRSVGITAAYNDFLEWINRRSSLPELRTASVIERDGYGWMEWIDSTACGSRDEVERYYRRAGMVLCALHALRFSDGHLENVVAAGEHPVVIDLETLFDPVVSADRLPGPAPGLEIADDSVIKTGLLPERSTVGLSSREEMSPMGGFGASEATVPGPTFPVFSAVNTDRMELEHEAANRLEGDNVPRLDGENVEPGEYTETIVRGFEALYRFLRDHRDDLRRDGGVLERFETETVRYVYRPTMLYGAVLATLDAPSNLRTGLEYGCTAERLADAFVEHDVDDATWSIFEAEVEAMARLDVPRFTALTDGTDLEYRGRVLEPDFFESGGLARVRERLGETSDADREEQCAYVQLAYDGPQTFAARGTSSTAVDESAVADRSALEPAVERAVEEIYERISSESIAAANGPTWFVRRCLPDGLQAGVLPPDLYHGQLGVGLFAAALARTFDDPRYREFAGDALEPVVDDVTTRDSLSNLSLGTTGLGSLVYGFTTVGRLLEDETYADVATRVASAITADRLADDREHDVLSGSAGALLGLLALYERTGDDDLLERARDAGDHLLANRVETTGGHAWRTSIDDDPLTGFAHGASGIAYALARLGTAAGDAEYVEAALDAVRFERRHYDPDRRNWRDRRSSAEPFMDAWCHGRTGIGFARLGIDAVVDDEPAVSEDLENALAGVDPTRLTPNDHLCCGNFGRVEFLLESGLERDEARHRERARTLAAACLDRADDRGRFPTRWGTDHWYDPTFYDGEAGIGYALLRLLDPGLPCVVRWE